MDGDAIVTGPMHLRADINGYVEHAFIRCGIYEVIAEGLEDYTREVAIPDAANVNLPDLLFPVVDYIEFSPAVPTELAVDEEVYITPTVYATDGRTAGAQVDVIWTSSNPQVLAVTPSGGVLTLRGVAPGTALVQAVRADQSIIRIPGVPIRGLPAAITVS